MNTMLPTDCKVQLTARIADALRDNLEQNGHTELAAKFVYEPTKNHRIEIVVTVFEASALRNALIKRGKVEVANRFMAALNAAFQRPEPDLHETLDHDYVRSVIANEEDGARREQGYDLANNEFEAIWNQYNGRGHYADHYMADVND